MGFLTALAAFFICGSLGLALRGWRVDYERPYPLWRRWPPVPLVGLIIALAFIYLPTDALIARFADLASTESISSDTGPRSGAT